MNGYSTVCNECTHGRHEQCEAWEMQFCTCRTDHHHAE